MDLSRLIQVARGREPADLLLKNARVVDLYNQEILDADVAIAGDRIAGLGGAGSGARYQARETHDVEGAYLAPGLIDGHVHIESSMVSVPEFARAVVPHGTTTVITDPHEIANVLGMSGIRYMLQAAKYNPLSVYVMASSCVPASPMESAGAELSAYDLETLMQDKWVLGLAEMMDAPGLLASNPEVLAKIKAAGARPVDGHAPGMRGPDLNAYIAAGVSSDHESTTLAEAREKLQRGMVVMLREASTARNLKELLPLITLENARRCMFVTDDRNPVHLLEEGHIDSMVRQAVGLGLDPILALQLGSLNAAEHFGLHDRGAVAPGKLADLIVVGARDEAVRTAVEAILDMQGGQVAVDGAEITRHPLPIAGLMSDAPLATVAASMRALLGAARRMGARPEDPFMTLSFMALSVVPALKLTDRGLLDVNRFELVPLFIE